jgi:hypothetical protein
MTYFSEASEFLDRVQYTVQLLKCMYNQLDCPFYWRNIMRVTGIDMESYWALKGDITQSQGGSPWSSYFRSEGSRGDQAGEAGPFYQRPRVYKLAQGKIRLASTLIRWFLWWPGRTLVRISGGRTQGLHSCWLIQRKLKTFKWGLENNSRKPENRTANRQWKSEQVFTIFVHYIPWSQCPLLTLVLWTLWSNFL